MKDEQKCTIFQYFGWMYINLVKIKNSNMWFFYYLKALWH